MHMKTLTQKLHHKLRILNDKLARIELMIVDKAKEIDERMQAECLDKKDYLRHCSLDVYLYFYTDYENDKCAAKCFEPMCKVSEGKYRFLTNQIEQTQHQFCFPRGMSLI